MVKRIMSLALVIILAFHGFVFANNASNNAKTINEECAALIIDTILDDNYVFFDKEGNVVSKDLREALKAAAVKDDINDCISLLANTVAFAEKKHSER